MTRRENVLYGTGRQRAVEHGFTKPQRKVYCVELDKVFNSVAEAAKTFNMSSSNIISCCRNRPGFLTCGGYHWRYYEEEALQDG